MPSNADHRNGRLPLMISCVWRDNLRPLLPEVRSHTAALKKYELESCNFTKLTLIWHCIKVGTRTRSTAYLWTIAWACCGTWSWFYIWWNIPTVASIWLDPCVGVLFLIIWFTIVYTCLWSGWTAWLVVNIAIRILMIVEIWVVRETFSIKNIAWNDPLVSTKSSSSLFFTDSDEFSRC